MGTAVVLVGVVLIASFADKSSTCTWSHRNAAAHAVAAAVWSCRMRSGGLCAWCVCGDVATSGVCARGCQRWRVRLSSMRWQIWRGWCQLVTRESAFAPCPLAALHEPCRAVVLCMHDV